MKKVGKPELNLELKSLLQKQIESIQPDRLVVLILFIYIIFILYGVLLFFKFQKFFWHLKGVFTYIETVREED